MVFDDLLLYFDISCFSFAGQIGGVISLSADLTEGSMVSGKQLLCENCVPGNRYPL